MKRCLGDRVAERAAAKLQYVKVAVGYFLGAEVSEPSCWGGTSPLSSSELLLEVALVAAMLRPFQSY